MGVEADVLEAQPWSSVLSSLTATHWSVDFHDEFVPEFRSLHRQVQDEVYAVAHLLYRALIRKADERFDRHLARLANEGGS